MQEQSLGNRRTYASVVFAAATIAAAATAAPVAAPAALLLIFLEPEYNGANDIFSQKDAKQK